MAFMPTIEEQNALEDTRERRADSGRRMPTRERRYEALIGLLFLVVVGTLWLLSPPASFAPLPAALCFIVLVLATRVRFDTPFGFTVATQLAFIPLLFALPVAVVPLAVAAALITASLPEVMTREVPRVACSSPSATPGSRSVPPHCSPSPRRPRRTPAAGS